MADITISLSQINKVKLVRINPLGNFKVRRMGAGESLDLQAKQRRLMNILLELNEMDTLQFAKGKQTKDKKEALDKMEKRSNELMEEVEQINRFKIDVRMACFDDCGTGKTKTLFRELSDDAIDDLLIEIFKPKEDQKAEEKKDDETS